MEINPIYLLGQIALITAITTPIIYYIYSQYRFSYWKRNGIRGPKPMAFIGNIFPAKKPLALMQLDYQKQFGNIYGIYRGLEPTLVVSDPAIIKRILVQDFHLFRNRNAPIKSSNVASQNLASACDDKWKRIRSILSPMFTTSKLRKMETLMSQCIDSLLNALGRIADEKKSFQVHDVMGNFTMDVIAKCAFATETNAHDDKENQFVKKARSVFDVNFVAGVSRFLLPQWLLDFLRIIHAPFFNAGASRFFSDTAYHLIRQRRNNPDIKFDDMLQLMIKAEHKPEQFNDEDDKFDSHHVNVGEEEKQQEQRILNNIIGSKYLSEEEIVAQCFVFFLAGYETTASTLTFCLFELVSNPAIQDKLYEEVRSVLDKGEALDYNNVMRLPYIDAVISETLRHHPPAFALTRVAAEPYYLAECDYTLRKGDMIRFPVYAIHHNPKFFPDPDRFDPERFMPENRHKIIPYTYLPFGGGPRNCIGMRFALSEAKLGLARMISQFSFHKTPQTPDELRIEKSFSLMKTVPVYVGVRRRT
ncbi:hypothetical protein DERP_012162 [Dermatophagoides pteronyssinus]|uniref:Uncharacterized protein n=1 Tax=Dermatophagoides pteronyssinus TaxID=6956 RepID=A0ABQ8J2C7_DERPT|nr:hypothetical protein DERP_012162 [Dermatophagoides pteronyssinus]